GGVDLDQSANTLTFNVTAANDAPVSTNDTVTVLEDTATALSLSDFGSYSDVEATAIAGVQITTLESLGTLQYSSDGTSWADVTLNQTISAADITAGKLRYTAGINANGANYATIGFKVYDGTDYSASAYTLTVSVTPVNDAPVIGSLDACSVNATSSVPYAPGGAAIVIDPDVTLGDRELGSERNNWNGAMLTIQRQTTSSVEDVFGAAGTSGSGLYLDANGVLKVDGSTIGSYTNAAGVLTLSFNGNATQTLADKAVQGVTYRNSNSTPNYASITLSYTLDDQNTNITNGGSAGTATGAQDQGAGGKLAASADIQIVMNHPPVAANDTTTVLEGLATSSVSTVSGNVVSGSGSGQDSDQDHDVLTVQGVVAGDQHGSTLSNAAVGTGVSGSYGSLNIGSDGAFTYTLDNTLAGIQALGANAHPAGSEVFTYTINDGKGGRSTATVTVTITGSNDAPVVTNAAAAIAGSVTEAGNQDDGTVVAGTPTATGTLSASDVDAGATKTWSLQGTPATSYGTMALDASTGIWTYTLDNTKAATQALREGDVVTQSYIARVTDDQGAYVEQTLTITINGSNDAPLVSGTYAHTVTDTAATDTYANLTGTLSATDVDAAETLSWSGSHTGTYGDLTVNPNGTYSYAVKAAAVNALQTGASPTESFTATVTDARGATATRTITIDVIGANDTPVLTSEAGAIAGSVTEAGNDAAGAVLAGTPTATGTLSASDVDIGATRTWSLQGTPGTSYGTMALDAGTGVWTYTLDNAKVATQALKAGQAVSETYTARVTDDKGAYVDQTVTVTINGSNDAPLAAADAASAVEAGGTANATAGANPTGNVLSNDTDPDTGDSMAVSAVSGSAAGVVGGATAGAYGTLTLNADGSYRYSVDNNAAAVQALRQSGDTLSDSFSYTISDSAGAGSTATLTVRIHGANDTPLAVADGGTVRQGETLSATAATGVLANDSDVDGRGYGETMVVAESSRGSFSSSYGRLTLNADGSYAYVADGEAGKALWFGDTATDSFSYTVQDAAGARSSATLSFTVAGVSVPVAAAPATTMAVAVPAIARAAVSPASLPAATRLAAAVDGSATPGAAVPGNAIDARAGTTVLRIATSAGQSGAVVESSGGESRRLESTDRGFPVERGQGDSVKLSTVQDQQKGGERLFVFNGIKNTATEVGQAIDYRVPKDAFGHTNTAAIVQLEASLSDGSPLPEWLDFDPTSGTFSGRPPASARGVIDVKVTARDDKGREVSSNFRVQIDGKAVQTAPGPGVERGEQNLPDDMVIRVAAEKLPPAKRGTVPFSDQLKLSKRDPLVERILSRQYADMRAGHTRRLPG
ncbi:MAG: VCBS domain-containing protein, partial [bacterium]